jgi:hypothetical protein
VSEHAMSGWQTTAFISLTVMCLAMTVFVVIATVLIIRDFREN